MIKKNLKLIIFEIKEKIRFMQYKQGVPKNPMHDDIYIVEFPKSGITWLQHLIGNIELLLLDKKEHLTFYNYHKYMPDIHQMRGASIDRILDRTFIKSHNEYNPYYYFVIYLIRNPYDVMVSYYNFMLSHGYDDSFENFVKSDQYGIKKWKSHINSWLYKKIDAQRIHFIRYEDLLLDTKKEIVNIYKNLGIDLDLKVLETALLQSDIKKMSTSEEHYRVYNPNYTMSFVGKKNKISKNQLLTKKIKNIIKNIANEEMQYFYQDIIKEKK